MSFSPALILVFALGSLGLILALTLNRHKHPLNLYLLFGFVSTLTISVPITLITECKIYLFECIYIYNRSGTKLMSFLKIWVKLLVISSLLEILTFVSSKVVCRNYAVVRKIMSWCYMTRLCDYPVMIVGWAC